MWQILWRPKQNPLGRNYLRLLKFLISSLEVSMYMWSKWTHWNMSKRRMKNSHKNSKRLLCFINFAKMITSRSVSICSKQSRKFHIYMRLYLSFRRELRRVWIRTRTQWRKLCIAHPLYCLKRLKPLKRNMWKPIFKTGQELMTALILLKNCSKDQKPFMK